jgi:hypothetical protein
VFALLNGAAIWGADAADMTAAYPCDQVSPDPAAVWYRAVTVHAPLPVVFRWLCQLKVAPYSYDLVDNGGRRSPRMLTPGVEQLATGQRVMSIFELVDFDQDAHLTIRLTSPRALALFGPLAGTYAVRELDATRTRLVVKLNVGLRGDNLLHRTRRWALAWGDLVMMHRQLRNVRHLAETTGPQL